MIISVPNPCQLTLHDILGHTSKPVGVLHHLLMEYLGSGGINITIYLSIYKKLHGVRSSQKASNICTNIFNYNILEIDHLNDQATKLDITSRGECRIVCSVEFARI